MQRDSATEKKPIWGERGDWLLAIAALIGITLFLGVNSLWNDEGIAAEIVREIRMGGDWCRLTFNGKALPGYPPLEAWTAAALSYPAGNITPWVLRLPAALGAVMMLVGTVTLGRSLFHPGVARIAGWLLVGSWSFLYWGRVAAPAMLTAGLITLAVAWGSRRDFRPDFINTWVLWCLALLGVLAGGFPALLVVAAFRLPFFWHSPRHPRWGAFGGTLLALGVYGCVIYWTGGVGGGSAAEWSAALRLGGGTLFGHWDEPVLRLPGEFFRLSAPWWLIAALSLAGVYRRFRHARPATRRLTAGALLALLVLAVCGAWRWESLLALLPALWLLTAAGLTGDGRREWNLRAGNWMRVIVIGAASAALVSLLLLPFWQKLVQFTPPAFFLWGLPLTGLAALTVMIWEERNDMGPAAWTGLPHEFAAAFLGGTILGIGLFAVLLPGWEGNRSLRPFLNEVRRCRAIAPEAAEIGYWGRRIDGRVLYYLQLPVPVRKIAHPRELSGHERLLLLTRGGEAEEKCLGRKADLREKYWNFENKDNAKMLGWLLKGGMRREQGDKQ